MVNGKMASGQGGFTLIEIIAVIILLGVLAAVIVPRYNSIVNDARDASANQAVAEAIARVNQAAASYILSVGTAPTGAQLLAHAACGAAAYNCATGAVVIGDYTVTFSDGGGSTVGISAVHTATGGTPRTATAQLPQ